MSTANNNKNNEPNSVKRLRYFLQERLVYSEGRDTNIQRDALTETKTAESNLNPVTSFTKNKLNALKEYRKKVNEQQVLKESQKDFIGRSPTVLPPDNNWIPIGPSSVRKGQAANSPIISGRTVDIAPLPNGKRVYIATANGGVWRSEDTGHTWKSLMDNHDLNPTARQSDSLACGAIAVIEGVTKEQDIIYVGSGEAQNLSRSGSGHTSGGYGGVGPIISTDGGQNWITEDSFSNAPSSPSDSLLGQAFFQLAVDPNDQRTVVAATTDGIYVREPISTGATTYVWRKKSLPVLGNTYNSTSVIAVNHNNSTFFYVAVNSASRGFVFESIDGQTWTAHGTNFPNSRVGRISLSAQADNKNVLYAQVTLSSATGTAQRGHLHGIYRWGIVDSTWRRISIPTSIRKLFGPDLSKGGQGHYDTAIAVAPDNPNTIIVGGSGLVASNKWVSALHRCQITFTTTPTSSTTNIITNLNATAVHIGSTVHADIHTIVWKPGQHTSPLELWVGCDGGVFYSCTATASNTTFLSKNAGLQTMTMNHLGLHPTEPSVIFCGTQDNGSIRYTGEEVWNMSFLGDGGYCVINWHKTNEILATYTNHEINYSNLGGKRGIDTGRNVTLATNENVLFYAPLVGTPYNPSSTTPSSEADLVAFGSERLWLSNDFGQTWASIPNNVYNNTVPNLAVHDRLDGRVRSIVFANPNKIYAGTMRGAVYRFIKTGTTWVATRLDDAGVAPKPLNLAITCIAIDPDNDDNIYITLGGQTPTGHVWYYTHNNSPTPTTSFWQSVSTGLLMVQHNSIIADPANPSHLYVGADIGVWHTNNKGVSWTPFSEGLPDAAVIDLEIFPAQNRGGKQQPSLLRVATHGRGVFERTIPDASNKKGIELYIRSTQLDYGYIPAQIGADLINPVDVETFITSPDSPDIKIDIPKTDGTYQFPILGNPLINYVEFVELLEDNSHKVVTHTSGTVLSKVYVQIHNRGIIPADDSKITALLAPRNISTLPENYELDIKNGRLINRDNWISIGKQTLYHSRPGFPFLVAFDLKSTQLPSPDDLSDNDEFILLILVHHELDEFDSTERDVQQLVLTSSKAALKYIKVEEFTGTVPNLDRKKPLAGFISIPASATQAYMPFDAMLGNAFRANDEFFLKKIKNALVHPSMPGPSTDSILHNGTTNIIDSTQILNALTIVVDADLSTTEEVPLIWYATEKITINQTINALGKGAKEKGDFGGSGGGGSTDGHDCEFPISGITMVTGGAAGASGASGSNGNVLGEEWASRAMLLGALCKGGSGGGSASGGRGGGVVILCAPTIEFGTDGNIDASGAVGGSGKAGGGGGGLVILIAHQFINVQEPSNPPNIIVAGGLGSTTSGMTGGTGGEGFIIKKEYA